MEGSCESRAHTARNSQDPLDHDVAGLALRQHGVVAGRQLVEIGLCASAVRMAICRDIGVPPDAVNEWIAYPDGSGAEADFLRRAQRLWRQVMFEPGSVARTLRGLLAERAGTPACQPLR